VVEAEAGAAVADAAPKTHPPVATGALDNVAVLVAVDAVASAASKSNLPDISDYSPRKP
jgi:hypothetical protein